MNTAQATRVVIIGSGFGGLCMAIKLRQAGVDNFVVLEKAASVGGTWRDNTYPGAACDVQSHLYSYSFEPKHDWTRKFGLQAEIRAYLEHCADKYGLRPMLRFNAEVTEAVFDETAAGWRVRTADGSTYHAQFVVAATGTLNRPSWPQIPGLDQFTGPLFHSARWDHRFDASGLRVGVIGTGASAIQFVPPLVAKARALTLFQRSAAWVIPKPDRAFMAWEQWLFRALPLWDRVYRSLIYWKNESRALGFGGLKFVLRLFAWRALRHMRRAVQDEDKRRKLTPDYEIGCKRILLSDDYYPALAEPHVEIVDTGIERVEPDGVRLKDGSRRELDALILGTGFRATEFLSPMRIRGLGGLDLNTAWADGAAAYKGISVSGFPNLFILYGPNTNLAHSSIVFMLESQVAYVMRCLAALPGSGRAWLDVRAEAQAAFDARMQNKLQGTVWASGCGSWYADENGKITTIWPGFTTTYRLLTRRLDLTDYAAAPAANP